MEVENDSDQAPVKRGEQQELAKCGAVNAVRRCHWKRIRRGEKGE